MLALLSVTSAAPQVVDLEQKHSMGRQSEMRSILPSSKHPASTQPSSLPPKFSSEQQAAVASIQQVQ